MLPIGIIHLARWEIPVGQASFAASAANSPFTAVRVIFPAGVIFLGHCLLRLVRHLRGPGSTNSEAY